jgi:hypothetical protein
VIRSNIDIFAASLLMINFTTTYTTSTTNGYRHDTTQSVVIQRGAQNRRARRVRRGYKKEQRSCEKILGITFHNSSLSARQGNKFLATNSTNFHKLGHER